MGSAFRRTLVASVMLAVILIASVHVPGAVASTAESPRIADATFTGDAVLATDDNETTLWTNESVTLSVAIDAPADQYSLCTQDSDGDSQHCRRVRLETDGDTTTISRFPWGSNATGKRTVVLTLESTGSLERFDSTELSVRLLDPAGDLDSDGLSNRAEVAAGTNMTIQDTDRDGLNDAAEIRNYGTDPLVADTDADGLTDATEVSGRTEPTDPDTDGDGLDDGREVNDLDTDPTDADTDGDGLQDGREVTELGTDPTLADTDGDGRSDGEEVAASDADPLAADAPADGDGGLLSTIGRWAPVVVLVVLVGAVVAVGILAGDRARLHAMLPVGDDGTEREPVGTTTREGHDGDVGAGDTVDVDEGEGGDERNEPQSATELPGEGAGDAGDIVSTADDPAASPPPTPILTDEERVVRLLDDNGGQMKQKRVVAETDWSKSKVSRLLSRMAEADRIRKITLGRENVIRLPDGEESGSGTDRTQQDRS